MLNKQPPRMPATQHKNWLKNCMEILLMTLRDNKKSSKSMIGLKKQKRTTEKIKKFYEKKELFDFKVFIFNKISIVKILII